MNKKEGWDFNELLEPEQEKEKDEETAEGVDDFGDTEESPDLPRVKKTDAETGWSDEENID